jgi:hypothetical protein
MKRWFFLPAVAVCLVLASPASSFAGDAFLKFGWTFSPDLGGFSNSWLFSGGSDWGFHPQGYWGLEFQGSYRSESEGSFKVTTVPANVLVNFKWKSEAESVRPFAGVGFGLVSSYVKVEAFGESEHEWIKDAGFQFMAGVELNRAFVIELLAQRIFEEGAQFQWSLLGGLRF